MTNHKLRQLRELRELSEAHGTSVVVSRLKWQTVVDQTSQTVASCHRRTPLDLDQTLGEIPANTETARLTTTPAGLWSPAVKRKLKLEICIHVCHLLHCVPKNAPTLKQYRKIRKITRIDFDDIWQKYSEDSRIEFACFIVHFSRSFAFLSTFRLSNRTENNANFHAVSSKC